MSASGAPTAYRLILDPPRRPTLNMAIDEHLCGELSAGRTGPIIRLYGWSVPAVTIGYFQRISAAVRLLGKEHPQVVRRLTGGGLVRHGSDVTLSLIVPVGHEKFRGEVKESYLRVSEAVRAGLSTELPGLDYHDCRSLPSGRGRGERICFDEPACYDLLWRGQKVLGASQRRFGGSILHQSSLQAPLSGSMIRERILKGFAEVWRASFIEVPLSSEELAGAERVERERYAAAEWAEPAVSR
ncbi:MAG: Octanoyltransferase LipM [Candidatus Omnitrophica bacterium]|nr:Octanoyltransferase LipM [Candidatus Omnitrophota bacterium]